jgi:hypothetical protein
MTAAAPAFITALEQQPFSQAIAESTWMFPCFESLHVLALTVVVGSVAMMDLRLLGIGSKNRAVSELTSSMLPWTWSAFAVALCAGLLLFSSKASTYYNNIPFRVKMVCMLFAAVNMLVFHLFTARNISAWDYGKPVPAARVAGAVSLALWITIVATGRWIGFTT